MTGPAAPFLADPTRQTNDYLSNYNEQLNDYMKQRQMYAASGGPGPVQQQAAQFVAQTDPLNSTWRDEDLVGAATYWGIPEGVARQMPHDQLVSIVNDYRSKARPEDFATQAWASMAALPAMFGVGAGEAATSFMQKLPLVGEWFQHQQWLHTADQYMRQLEEGVRSSTPEWEQKILSVDNVAGNVAAMWYPAQAAWAAAGLAGMPVGALTGSKFAMGAVQGGISSYLLDGGSQDFKDHPVFAMGLGAVLGGAIGGLGPQVADQGTNIKQAIQSLAGRVTGKFMPPAAALAGAATSLPIDAETALRGAAQAGDEQAQSMLDYLTSQRSTRTPGINTEQADAFAAQMNKAATVVQSPAFIDIAGQADVTEGDVARASVMSNPGGVNIVPGVSDPIAVAQSVPDKVVFARRGDRLDAIIVPPDRSPHQILAQYEKTGFFAGQAVRDPHGVEGTVDFINPAGRARFVPRSGGIGQMLPIEQLSPMLGTPGVIPAPGMWDAFSRYADSRAAESAMAMGGTQPELVHQMRARNMMLYANQYLDEQGIVDPRSRQNLLNYFDQRYVQSYKDMVPALAADVDQMAPEHSVPSESTPLYHGTPLQEFDAPTVPGGRYGGISYSEDRGIAAGYAGPDGRVLEGRLKKGARVLDATGTNDDTWHWIPLNEWHKIWDAAPEYGLHLENLNFHVQRDSPLTWEALFNMDWSGGFSGTRELGAVVHNVLGYDVIRHFEAAPGISGDMAIRGFPDNVPDLSKYSDPFSIPSLTVLDPAVVEHGTSAGKASLADLDQLANTKGFIAIPDGPSITLRDVSDTQAPGEIRFNSVDAATTWVRNINRELQDITPQSDVPVQIAGRLPLDATQAPNLNAQHVPGMMKELAAIASDDGVPIDPATKAAAAAGDHSAVHRNWMTRSMDWMPRRRLFSFIDQKMVEADMGMGIAADYHGHKIAVNIADNSATEYQQALAELTSKIEPANARDGTWTRFLALDPDTRATEAAAAGLTPKEISAYDDWDELIRKIHPGSSDEDVQAVGSFFNHIGTRQSDPATFDQAFEEFQHAPTTQDFYDYARGGHLNFRQADPRIVGDQYIRAVMWNRGGAADSYDNLMAKWKPLTTTPEFADAARMMVDWLKQSRYGYNPADDALFSTVGGAMEKLMGAGWSDDHTKSLFRMGINSVYAGMLGYRPAMLSRDALRMFFALPKIGTDLLSTMGRWATDSSFRQAAFDAAVREGGISVRPSGLAAPGAFEASSEALTGGSVGLTDASQMSGRMKAALAIRDGIGQALPEWAKPSQDEITHPLYLLTKQLQAMRAIVYTAAKQRASAALENYAAAGSTDFNKLLGESGMRTLDPSWQRQFQQIVASGNHQAASIFAGQQMAAATMFEYGSQEAPIVARTLTGRVGLQMGHFAQQVLQYLREGSTNGTVVDKTKFWLTAGGVTYALNDATDKYGWNFKWMNPYYGLGFAGGPLLELGGGAMDFIRGAASVAKGENVGPGALTTAGHTMADLAEHMNPGYGLYRTGQGIGQALTQSPYPAAALARNFITGEVGPGPDVNAYQMPQADRFFQQSLHQQQNPVSMTRQGLPPGMVPPQMLSYPPLIQNAPVQQGAVGGIPGATPSTSDNDPNQPTPYPPEAGQSSGQDHPGSGAWQ